MAINNFNVTYDRFELDNIIEPDEFNVNFADIMIRFNQIIDVLNQITDGIPDFGSKIINVGPVDIFTADNLHDFMLELTAQLRDDGSEFSGSEYIGARRIDGVDGRTVHAQLMSIAENVEELRQELRNEVIRLDSRIDGNSADIQTLFSDAVVLASRVTKAEQDIADRAKQVDTYTKDEVDTIAGQVEANFVSDYYSKLEANARFTQIDGDHEGTWQGIEVDDISDVIGVSGVSVQETRPSNPLDKELWYNPYTNEYRLFLNGRWRIQTTPTQIKQVHSQVVLPFDNSSISIGIEDFDSQYDTLLVSKNSVNVFEGEGYEVYDTSITTSEPWDKGTVVDFTALISVPLIGLPPRGHEFDQALSDFDARATAMEGDITSFKSTVGDSIADIKADVLTHGRQINAFEGTVNSSISGIEDSMSSHVRKINVFKDAVDDSIVDIKADVLDYKDNVSDAIGEFNESFTNDGEEWSVE